jgi:hypothetical protein
MRERGLPAIAAKHIRPPIQIGAPNSHSNDRATKKRKAIDIIGS